MTQTGAYDSNITGFKAFYLTTFLLAMVWVGIHPVLVPTFILAQTGSATDVALVLALMSLGALAVPLGTGVADRYRAHREVQLVCLLVFGISYLLIAFTQRPLLFALSALLTGIGMGGASVFVTVFIVAGDYSEQAQAHALAMGSRLWLVGQVVGAALVAGMLALDLSFQIMFAVSAVILAITLGIAYLTTGPLAKRVLATANELAANQGQAEGAGEAARDWKAVLFSPFGMVILAILLAYGGWQALNGQYANYFYGAFGIEPELSAAANSVGALLGILTVGFYARWQASSGALPQFNFHALARLVGALALVGLGFTLVGGTAMAPCVPLVIYILLMQLRPVQDIAYPTLAARTAPGGAAMAQGVLTLTFALAMVIGNLGAGFVAENSGWRWVPVLMAVLGGLALVVGLRGRRIRDQYLAEVNGEKEAEAKTRVLGSN